MAGFNPRPRHVHTEHIVSTVDQVCIGCVAPKECVEGAHGNIRRTETCECGAVCVTNINSTHEESIGWVTLENAEDAALAARYDREQPRYIED